MTDSENDQLAALRADLAEIHSGTIATLERVSDTLEMAAQAGEARTQTMRGVIQLLEAQSDAIVKCFASISGLEERIDFVRIDLARAEARIVELQREMFDTQLQSVRALTVIARRLDPGGDYPDEPWKQ